MPPYKRVTTLQELSLHTLAICVSKSIASLVNGTYARAKYVLESKSTKSKHSKKSQFIVVVPTKEIQRIKVYIWHGSPKAIKAELFHKVLLQVTNLVLKTKKSKLGSNRAPNYKEQLLLLDESFMYVFAILLDPEISWLDFTDVLHKTMKWVDTCRLNNTNPKEVGLNYSKIETIFLKYLSENAKNMRNLLSVSWPHLVSGDLVRIITGNFQNLKTLTLACACETGPFIEEERKGVGTAGSQEDLISSLKTLFSRSPGNFCTVPNGCLKLKKLVLPNLDDDEGKAAVIIANALAQMPLLEFVSGISTLTSLMRLCQMKHRPTTLSLKNISDYDPFKRRLMPEVNFLENLLPKLECIELRVSKDLTKRILTLFKDVKELSIEWPDFHIYVKNYGSLTSLNISLDFQCPWPLILVLSRTCKNLRHLTLEHPTFKVDPLNLQHLKPPSLSNLNSFKLIRSSFIEFTAFKTFILGCPQLTELYITLSNDRNYMVDEFNDQLIRAIAPHMKNLKKFTAECLYKYNLYLHINCVLSSTAADVLIANCPNLKFIGHMDSWDVNDNDVKELNLLMKKNNWDLELA